MATCAISGNVCEEPMVSLKSGHVFEKRLIVKQIELTGRCPITNEELSLTDLLSLKSNPVVKPRPPAATSIPKMVQIFQNEWDALMLETYTLKQQLERGRQELAHALYQHDAACRVIARLIKERDQARTALAQMQKGEQPAPDAAGSHPEAAQQAAAEAMDGVEFGEDEKNATAAMGKKMQAVAKALSKDRKSRVKEAQKSAASREAVSAYALHVSHPLHSPSKPGITALDLHPTERDLVATAGHDATAIIFNISSGKITDTLKGHSKKVTDVKFHPKEPLLFTTSADHTAIIWNGSSGKYTVKHTLEAHKAEVVGVTVHPSGDYVVTAAADACWALFDVAAGRVRQTVTDEKASDGIGYSRVTFHPDGLILGCGTTDSVVRVFDVRAQKNVATFKGHMGAVSGLSFSENGYYLASGDEQGTIKLWDLRHLQNFHTLAADQLNGAINAVEFDASGSYLAVCSRDLRVFSAVSKQWDLIKTFSDHTDMVTSAKFGPDSTFLASTSMDRSLKVFRGAKA